MKLTARMLVRIPRLMPVSAPRGSRRKSARAAVAHGILAFILANVALACVLEKSHREWRDPEFGHRLMLLRERRTEAPGRPIVLTVGSSRIQQSIYPTAMGMPDGPTDPLVFNFGYRAATPATAVLNVFRVLDSGIRPDFVLIEFTPVALLSEHNGRGALRLWSNRLTVADVLWFADAGLLDLHAPGTSRAVAEWARLTVFPWTSHRQALMAHWLPRWVPASQAKALGSERMDRDGFTEMIVPSDVTEHYTQNPQRSRARFGMIAEKTVIAENAKRAYSRLLERCRAEGIPVAFVWVPLAPLLTGRLHPDAKLASTRFAEELSREPGVVVFPPPDWVTDYDFADGQHLLPNSASKFSRWLADTHLKQWLTQQRAVR